MIKARSVRTLGALPLHVVRAVLSLIFSLFLGSVLLGALGLGLYMLYLDSVIRTEFDGKRWAMPARVYARPLELFESMSLSADAFAQELKLLGYRDVNCPEAPPEPVEKNKRRFKRKAPPRLFRTVRRHRTAVNLPLPLEPTRVEVKPSRW